MYNSKGGRKAYKNHSFQEAVTNHPNWAKQLTGEISRKRGGVKGNDYFIFQMTKEDTKNPN